MMRTLQVNLCNQHRQLTNSGLFCMCTEHETAIAELEKRQLLEQQQLEEKQLKEKFILQRQLMMNRQAKVSCRQNSHQ